MNYRTGTQVDYGRIKFEVELNDDDFQQLCSEQGIVYTAVSLIDRYQLLRLWCEQVKADQLLRGEAVSQGEAAATVAGAKQGIAVIVAKYAV